MSITPRAEVLWFAEQMELKLRENDHKVGWLGIGMEYALRRMRQEMAELEQAIAEFSRRNDDGTTKSNVQIAEACNRIVRVANFAMVIADELKPRAVAGGE